MGRCQGDDGFPPPMSARGQDVSEGEEGIGPHPPSARGQDVSEGEEGEGAHEEPVS